MSSRPLTPKRAPDAPRSPSPSIASSSSVFEYYARPPPSQEASAHPSTAPSHRRDSSVHAPDQAKHHTRSELVNIPNVSSMEADAENRAVIDFAAPAADVSRSQDSDGEARRDEGNIATASNASTLRYTRPRLAPPRPPSRPYSADMEDEDFVLPPSPRLPSSPSAYSTDRTLYAPQPRPPLPHIAPVPPLPSAFTPRHASPALVRPKRRSIPFPVSLRLSPSLRNPTPAPSFYLTSPTPPFAITLTVPETPPPPLPSRVYDFPPVAASVPSPPRSLSVREKEITSIRGILALKKKHKVVLNPSDPPSPGSWQRRRERQRLVPTQTLWQQRESKRHLPRVVAFYGMISPFIRAMLSLGAAICLGGGLGSGLTVSSSVAPSPLLKATEMDGCDGYGIQASQGDLSCMPDADTNGSASATGSLYLAAITLYALSLGLAVVLAGIHILTASLHAYLFKKLSLPWNYLQHPRLLQGSQRRAEEGNLLHPDSALGQSIPVDTDDVVAEAALLPLAQGAQIAWVWWAWWAHRRSPLVHVCAVVAACTSFSAFAVSLALAHRLGAHPAAASYLAVVASALILEPAFLGIVYLIQMPTSWRTFVSPPLPKPKIKHSPPPSPRRIPPTAHTATLNRPPHSSTDPSDQRHLPPPHPYSEPRGPFPYTLSHATSSRGAVSLPPSPSVRCGKKGIKKGDISKPRPLAYVTQSQLRAWAERH